MKYLEFEERPWGSFYVIHDESTYKLKRIEVKPNQRLSYQYHNKRAESWTIVKGSGRVTINGKETDLFIGDTIFINKKDKHRMGSSRSTRYWIFRSLISYRRNNRNNDGRP